MAIYITNPKIVNPKNVFDLANNPHENSGRSDGTQNGYSCTFRKVGKIQFSGTIPSGTKIIIEARTENSTEFLPMLTVINKDINTRLDHGVVHRLKIEGASVTTNIIATIEE